MGCEICGRNNCVASFHSLEEQQSFDSVADKIKDRVKRCIAKEIGRLNGHYHGDNYYVRLDEVIKKIDDYS